MKSKKLTFLVFSSEDFGTGPHVHYIVLLKVAYLHQELFKVLIQALFPKTISKPHVKEKLILKS